MRKVLSKNSYTSIVYHDTINDIIIKKITHYTKYDVYRRELFWLKYLNEKGYEWCPDLVGYDDRRQEIHMENVGVPISKKNAPKDWREQLIVILNDLREENIFHNDIKRSEVLVKDGKLYLIDYGWASLGNDWSCGGEFDAKTKPYHTVHDKDALKRIAKALNSGKV